MTAFCGCSMDTVHDVAMSKTMLRCDKEMAVLTLPRGHDTVSPAKPGGGTVRSRWQ